MIISANEFKSHIEEYLELVQTEPIYIQKNNRVIAKLSKPWSDRRAVLESLVGVASSLKDRTLEDIKNERLSRQ